ncbi:hypothetical protein DSO57_1036639 [Entomophthora muscae]|uniref:Uncharacterized protein n=2 Tax=Entomophthora muscae TaxID=34485 RepID=A0ACC2RE21_9FUNG|nr:hypothetical protein DSO57_1036636 [Entomophthora muscae]KAJ9048281.1 hypothetical protein DSO57_1036639 [Entomophthora muscae]
MSALSLQIAPRQLRPPSSTTECTATSPLEGMVHFDGCLRAHLRVVYLFSLFLSLSQLFGTLFPDLWAVTLLTVELIPHRLTPNLDGSFS